MPVTPEHDEYECPQPERCRRAQHLGDLRDDDPVFSRHGIVVIAEQQHLGGGRADFIGGSLDQTQAEIPGLVFDPVEVARDLALRSQDHDRAGVGELLADGVVFVMESHGVGEAFDRVGSAGQKMPALLGARAIVLIEVVTLLCSGELPGFLRIKTDSNHVIVGADIQGDLLHGMG